MKTILYAHKIWDIPFHYLPSYRLLPGLYLCFLLFSDHFAQHACRYACDRLPLLEDFASAVVLLSAEFNPLPGQKMRAVGFWLPFGLPFLAL